jgi:hypothetical protein
MDFLSVCDFSPLWELLIRPPWLERETWDCESPIPVPAGTTYGPQELIR